MKTNNTPKAKKITVIYDDGSTKELLKGVAFRFEDNGDSNISVTADMVGMEGRDLGLIVSSVLQLGYELGMFNHQGGSND